MTEPGLQVIWHLPALHAAVPWPGSQPRPHAPQATGSDSRSWQAPSQLARPPSSAELQKKALAFLITSTWLQGEATAQGIRVSEAEVEVSYARLLDGPDGQAFAEGLQERGLSRTDELLLLRLARLGVKLIAKIATGAGSAEGRRRVSSFIAAYRRRWKQRTTCQPGYLIPQCRRTS